MRASNWRSACPRVSRAFSNARSPADVPSRLAGDGERGLRSHPERAVSYYESTFFKLSPQPVQGLILSARNAARRMMYRLGRVDRVLADLEITEGWTRPRLERYQAEQLRLLVAFAMQHVSHYRGAFSEAGVAAEVIQGVQDIRRLPLLPKAAVRGAVDSFLADSAHPRLLSRGGTSGSTGAPLTLFRDLASVCREEARLRRWRRRAGIDVGERRVVIRGDNFMPAASHDRQPWLHDRTGGLLLVSSYHLTDDLLPAITEEIVRFQPAAIEGYPGSLITLARYVAKAGVGLRVRAVLTSSEQVYDQHRRLLHEAFGAEVFDQYGSAERVALASECSRHHLHVDMECCLVEVVRADGTPCDAGEEGEIVGTCLTNFAMPLIRYRTGDIARLSDEPCACGLRSPYIDGLQGRDDDFVFTADGRRFAPTILTFPFEDCAGVEESQLIQPAPGKLLVKLVAAQGYADASLAEARRYITEDLTHRLGGGIEIDYEIVPEIPKQPNGKFRWIVALEQRSEA